MYPFQLIVEQKTGSSIVKNSDGDYIDVAGTLKLVEIPCRYSMNNQGRFVPSQDGAAIVYSFTVSMPLGHPELFFGQLVKVYDGEDLLKEGTVKMYNRGLMDAKAWV